MFFEEENYFKVGTCYATFWHQKHKSDQTTEFEVRRRLPGEDGAVVVESSSSDPPSEPGETTFLRMAMPFLAGVEWGMNFFTQNTNQLFPSLSRLISKCLVGFM